ncbi:MAG: hypothetical protein SFU20_05770 [Chitinophagaceae bacterium]|nr:hypothetical protein [Chitinophagaceae bacterium]
MELVRQRPAGVDKAGIVDKGTLETSHGDTKVDPDVFKAAEELEKISVYMDPNDNRHPNNADYLISGSVNETIFQKLRVRLRSGKNQGALKNFSL